MILTRAQMEELRERYPAKKLPANFFNLQLQYQGHYGPYWYASWRDTAGKQHKTYIGKQCPVEVTHEVD